MYYAKVNWFDTYKEEDAVSYLLIPTANWNDAMQKVSGEFEFINSIEMKEVNFEKGDVIYLPEDSVASIIEENTY